MRVIQVQIIAKLESAKYFIDLTSQFYFHIWISNVMQVSHSEQIRPRNAIRPLDNNTSKFTSQLKWCCCILTELDAAVERSDDRIGIINVDLETNTLVRVEQHTERNQGICRTHRSDISKLLNLGSASLVLLICHFDIQLVGSRLDCVPTSNTCYITS